MNKAILIGRLTKDPESRTTASGTTCAMFTLAVDRRKGNSGERESDFINIVAWRQTAELVVKYLNKGRQVAVVGRIQTRSYNAQDGTKRYVTEVVAEEVQFIGSVKSNQSVNESRTEDNVMEGFTPVEDTDELPF